MRPLCSHSKVDPSLTLPCLPPLPQHAVTWPPTVQTSIWITLITPVWMNLSLMPSSHPPLKTKSPLHTLRSQHCMPCLNK